MDLFFLFFKNVYEMLFFKVFVVIYVYYMFFILGNIMILFVGDFEFMRIAVEISLIKGEGG